MAERLLLTTTTRYMSSKMVALALLMNWQRVLQRESRLHSKITTTGQSKLQSCECAGRCAKRITCTSKGKGTMATPIMQTAFWCTILVRDQGGNDCFILV